jgi:hypothetical protein
VSRIFFPHREFSSGQWYFCQTIAHPHSIRIFNEGKHWGDGKNAAGSKSLKPWRAPPPQIKEERNTHLDPLRERCCGSDRRDHHIAINPTLQWSGAGPKKTIPA